MEVRRLSAAQNLRNVFCYHSHHTNLRINVLRRYSHAQAGGGQFGNDLSPSEISRLMEEHAKHPPQPLTLSTFLSLAKPLTQDSVLRSVGYVLTEIPRRLAMRARSIEALPFIVGMNPFIARTLQSHRKSFQFLIMYPPVKTLEENAVFAEQLAVVVQNHANDVPTMAKGSVVALSSCPFI